MSDGVKDRCWEAWLEALAMKYEQQAEAAEANGFVCPETRGAAAKLRCEIAHLRTASDVMAAERRRRVEAPE